jgi:hypothetical protein
VLPYAMGGWFFGTVDTLGKNGSNVKYATQKNNQLITGLEYIRDQLFDSFVSF